MQQQHSHSSIDALVIGAGPVGLTMAAELTRYGVSCRIVDKSPMPSQLSKALGVQARTLEVFEDMGVIEPFLSEAIRMTGVNIYDAQKKLAQMRFDDVDLSDLPYPFGMIIPQSSTERILLAHLVKSGIEVERPKELLNFEQDADGINVTLNCADGTREQVRTKWLLGCDGASSMVRSLLGLAFEGDTYKEAFWVADVVVDTPLPSSEIHSILHPDGMMMLFPLYNDKKIFRLVANVLENVSPTERPTAPTLEQVQHVIKTRCPFPLEVRDPLWLSAFRIHHRKVNTYRHGRVFLSGDAAHIHSPMGGQGMNTGIQDAYNLAWKIALVQRGFGSDALLDSYNAEREPLAAQLLKATNRITKVATTRNPILQKLRNRIVPLVAGTEAVQEKIIRTMAEVDLDYRDSPLSVQRWSKHSTGIQTGDRAPDAALVNATTDATERIFEVLKDTRFMALLFSGTQPSDADIRNLRRIARELHDDYGVVADARYVVANEHARILLAGESTPTLVDSSGLAHERYEATEACLYLIRPDGYIAYRSMPADVEHFTEYLRVIFGSSASEASSTFTAIIHPEAEIMA